MSKSNPLRVLRETTPARPLPRVDISRVLLLFPFGVSQTYDLATIESGGYYIEAPLGLGYVSSYLAESHPQLVRKTFDANAMAVKTILAEGRVDMPQLWAKLGQLIREFKPDLVGISCLFINIALTAHRTAALVKSECPHAITVLGGHYPAGMPQATLEDPNVDFVVLSEGEKAFSGLITALLRGEDPAQHARGLVFDPARLLARSGVAAPTDSLSASAQAQSQLQALHRSLPPPTPAPSSGHAHDHDHHDHDHDHHDHQPGSPSDGPAALVQVERAEATLNLEEYPWPDRTEFDMDLYATYTRHFCFRVFDREGSKLASMTASRGCPFKCTFCQSTEFWGNTSRYRDPKDVVDEMSFLHTTYGINTFVFNDDNIMFRRKSLIALCDEIARRRLGIRWMSGGGIQVSTMKPDVVQALVETGFLLFNLAIETGNPETLKRIKKPLVKGVAEQAIANIRKYPQTWVCSNFITGFYFETLSDVDETLEYAGTLDLDWCSIYSFTPLPGTHDYRACVERGYIKDWDRTQGTLDDDFIALSTENFTAEEVRQRNYHASLRYNFLQNRNIVRRPRQAARDFSYVISDDPDNALAYFSRARAHEQLRDWKSAMADYDKALQLSVGTGRNVALRSHRLWKKQDHGHADEGWAEKFARFGIEPELEVARLRQASIPSVITHSESP